MKLGEIQPGIAAICQFIVRTEHNFNARELVRELQSRLHEVSWQNEFIAVRKEKQHGCVYKITFPMKVKPHDVDLTIAVIKEQLDSIEEDVERAVKIKKLAEMVE